MRWRSVPNRLAAFVLGATGGVVLAATPVGDGTYVDHFNGRLEELGLHDDPVGLEHDPRPHPLALDPADGDPRLAVRVRALQRRFPCRLINDVGDIVSRDGSSLASCRFLLRLRFSGRRSYTELSL